MSIPARIEQQTCIKLVRCVQSCVVAMVFSGFFFSTSAYAQTPAVPKKATETAAHKRDVDAYGKLTQSASQRQRAARDAEYKKKLCSKIKSQLENFESHQRMGRAPIMLRMRLELATTCSTQGNLVE